MSGRSARLRHPGLNLGEFHGEAHEEAEEAVFGFWVFLMSDLVLFSLLFATFATMLHSQAGGPGPHALFDIKSAAVETTALLLSSFTFGLASLSMKYDEGVGRLIGWLCVTLALGLLFLGLEVHDFLSMAGKDGLPSRSGYVSSLYALVSTHGMHVTAGSVWIVVMIVQLLVFGSQKAVKLRIMRLALFWHFLDIVWIGIFSVVYLLGLA